MLALKLLAGILPILLLLSLGAQRIASAGDIGYAILVAGSAEENQFNVDTNRAYEALLSRGFDNTRIHWISSANCTLDALRSAFNWASVRVAPNSPLILYFSGHGAPDQFSLNSYNITPSAVEFPSFQWALESDEGLGKLPPGTPTLIILDSCFSGGFISRGGVWYNKRWWNDLGTISSANRIVITSTHHDGVSPSLELYGSFFSHELWSSFEKGLNVKQAFIEASERANSLLNWVLLLGKRYEPWLDDNGDALGHPPEALGDDGGLAATMTIGTSGGAPSIGEDAPNPALFNQCYTRNGGSAVLGYPINKVHRWWDGYIQDFRGGEGYEGAIMQPDGVNDAFAVYGAIWAKYLSKGGAGGPLVYPLTDETEGPVSSITGARCRYNKFIGGAIVYREGTGEYESKTVFLGHGIFNKWEELGYGASKLGLPITDEYTNDSNYPQADFEGGYITTTDGTNYQAFILSTPPAPTHVSPSNGQTDVSLTPTFKWSRVPGADYYGLYISEPPYGESHLVFDSTEDYGPIYGTSFTLPSGRLSYGLTYRWNMNSHNSAGWGSYSKPSWSFTTGGAPVLPFLSIADASVAEGDSGSKGVIFGVTLSRASDQEVTAGFATADGGATAPSDYQAQTGTLTFAPGDTYESIVVLVHGDTLVESDEAFYVNLSGAVNANISDGFAVGMIENDDEDDTLPASPNPMTWATEPYQTGAWSIRMVATTAEDASGVEYYFEETSGNPGGSDSGWRDSPTYEDAGLQAGTAYTYRVKARDKSANRNQTSYSEPRSATTDIGPDMTPPSPNPMTWATEPYGAWPTAITMVATVASDSRSPPVSYYFEFCSSPAGGTGASDSGWQSSNTYTDSGLEPNHQYGYRVKARDTYGAPNETDYSPICYAYTPPIEESWKSPTASGIYDEGWSTPENAYASDNQYAVAFGGYSIHDWYNFGFNIPSGATIDGIEIKIEGTGNGDDYVGKVKVMVRRGTFHLDETDYLEFPATEETIHIVGGPSDLWGWDSWKPENFHNDADNPFIVRLSTGADWHTARIDHIQARVYYEPPEIVGDFCGTDFSPPDGYVDVWDLMQFADHWHTRTTDSNWDGKFDLAGPDFGNIDGYVDVWDLMVFADNWHTGQKP